MSHAGFAAASASKLFNEKDLEGTKLSNTIVSVAGKVRGTVSETLSAFGASMSLRRKHKRPTETTDVSIFGFSTTAASFRKKAFVDGVMFNIVICLFIVLNGVVMGFEADLRRDSEDNPVWSILENIFCSVWVIEAACKLYYDRARYFYNSWNVTDFALAILAVLEAWVMPLVNTSMNNKEDGFADAVLSRLELFRIARLLRLIKLMRMFQELWIIVIGFMQALRTFIWVLLLLTLVIYSCAIYTTIVVGYTCDSDFAWWDDCEEFFGRVPLSMYTLFQVMTLESWSSAVARKLLKVNPYMVVFFVVFLLTTTFGLLNIIVGVIVENTLLANNKARREQARAREADLRNELQELRGLFLEFDSDGSGLVDEEEFAGILQNDALIKKLEEMNIHVTHPSYLFNFIDKDDSGNISVDEFIDGLMAYKSFPSHQEMHALLMQIRVAERQVMNISSIMMGGSERSDSPSPSSSPTRKKSGGRVGSPTARARWRPGSPKSGKLSPSREGGGLKQGNSPTGSTTGRKQRSGGRQQGFDDTLAKEYSELLCECPRTVKMPLGAIFCCFCGLKLHVESNTARTADDLQEVNHWAPPNLPKRSMSMPSKFPRSDSLELSKRLDELTGSTCRRLQSLESVMESLAKSQHQVLDDVHRVLNDHPARNCEGGPVNRFGLAVDSDHHNGVQTSSKNSNGVSHQSQQIDCHANALATAPDDARVAD